MKTIIFTAAALSDLESLPQQDRLTVESALEDYAISGRGHVIRLTGRAGYRMRVGTYRVIFDEDRATILAFYVGRRSTTTYKRN